MARVSEEVAGRLRHATVRVLLELRAAYLRSGGSPIKHWSQIEDRMRAATRTSGSVEEWVTRMRDSLQLSGITSSASSAVVMLRDELDSTKTSSRSWLDLIEREATYIMALARVEAEDRKEKANGDA